MAKTKTQDIPKPKEKLRLQPEHIVSEFSELGKLPDDFNPYGNYVVDKLRFLGDTEPNLFIDGHKNADQWFVVNDGDQDLNPIYISLPKPPDLKFIEGYGKEPDEQYFVRLSIPERLKELQSRALDNLDSIQKRNYQETIQGYKLYKEYWNILNDESDIYWQELEWIKKIWWYRTYGYWFYNDGVPTYITGDHFDFLQFWYIAEAGVFPEYRDKDRRKYLFAKYIEEATETFAKLDKDTGRALKEPDGSYEMVDLGRRVMFGDINPKTRRTGITHQCVHKVWKGNSTSRGSYGTIISMEGDNAEKHYFKKLLPAWDKYPMFLKPIWSGNRRPNSIKMVAPPNVYDFDGLESLIDFTDSSGVSKNDGDRLNYVLLDEEGKCFGYGTEIIMADGSIKQVQDIKEGEQVMGDDGHPRNVYGCTQGNSEMFKVSSKFGEFICNKEHILSLRSSGIVAGCKSAGEIINLPLKDVINLTDSTKRNLKLYRKPIVYKEKYLDIEPYMLGLWLGDGSVHGTKITNTDREIIGYIKEYCDKNELKVNVENKINYRIAGDNINCVKEYNDGKYIRSYNSVTAAAHAHNKSFVWVKHFSLDNNIKHREYNKIRFHIYKPINNLYRALYKYGLIYNKHIPDRYLKNSFNNRLQLLAGLIDTDGGKSGKPTSLCYEIVQKNKLLAEQICQLANGLGFYSSISRKIARMKRKDNSYYSCEVYRVRIYGDLYKIPVRVKHKQYLEPSTWRNKNPNTSWFKIASIGMGKYYGFAVDGNHLFLLKNQIVVHNTVNSDIFERWNVNKMAMSTGGGTNIIKNCYAMNPSTVEEMEAGGISYYKLAQLSCFYERLPAKGQTYSGLARVFFPAYDGLEGYIDRFGMSVIGNPTERQIRLSPHALFALSKKGAKETLQAERDALLAKGTPEAMESYRSLRRKHPFCWAECWLGAAGNVGFNMEKIDRRIGEINRDKSFGKTGYKIGNFYWENGIRDSRVLWQTDPINGKFKLSMDLPPELTNLRTQEMGFDISKGTYVPMWKPVIRDNITIGADPIRIIGKNEAKVSISGSRQSDFGIAGLYIDGKGVKEFILTYRYRPATQEEGMEDVIMAMVYLNALLYQENNVERLFEYVMQRGYGLYLIWDIDIRTGKTKDKPGVYTTAESKMAYFATMKGFVEDYALIQNHDDMLQEIKDIKGTEDMTHRDLFTAGCLALMGGQSRYRQIMDVQNNMVLNLDGIGMFKRRRI